MIENPLCRLKRRDIEVMARTGIQLGDCDGCTHECVFPSFIRTSMELNDKLNKARKDAPKREGVKI